MSIIASIIAALVPMLFYLVFLWKMDRYEPEPVWMVAKHFLWGALGAVLFGVLVSSFFSEGMGLIISNENTTTLLGAVLIAPFVEEITKEIYLLRSVKQNYFDNMTDGLVYGGAIGLGFGLTENLMYFTLNDDTFMSWLSLVFVRSMFSATMHAIATATFGAFLAKAKFSNKWLDKISYPIVGIILAMSFHAIWNLTVSFQFSYFVGILFMVVLFIGFGLIFRFSLNTEKKIIQSELEEEIEIINFPPDHIPIVSTSKKVKRNWVNNKVRKEYTSYATKLAFRKFQAKHSSGLRKENYLA
ncbi:MAG: PrsW family intramembrane metalloprotease, partial [Melioribacteraceae bacterium]